MRRLRIPWLLILPLLVSCGEEDCDPSQPCGQPYSLQLTVRDTGGSPVEGLEVFGMTATNPPLIPLARTAASIQAAATMEFDLPQACYPQIDIFNVLRERVRRLLAADTERPVGIHRVVWDGRDDQGLEVAGGYYRVEFSAFDADDKLLFSDTREGYLNGIPVAMGKTDADGRLTSTDIAFFPNLILGDDYEMPLVDAFGATQGTFDLSGGTRIQLSDGQGSIHWYNIPLTSGHNEFELEWCPDCPVPLQPTPAKTAPRIDTPGPDPLPPSAFDFTGFFPNPFN
jgi:hypothetical protein